MKYNKNYVLRKSISAGVPKPTEGIEGDLKICHVSGRYSLYAKTKTTWKLVSNLYDTDALGNISINDLPMPLNGIIEIDKNKIQISSKSGIAKTKANRLILNENTNITGSLKLDTIAAAGSDTDKFLVSDSGTIKYRTGTQILSDLGISADEIIDWTADQGDTNIHANNIVITHNQVTDFDTEITSAIDALIDSAPGALNTLNELAAALGDDANFSTTVTNSLALKAPLAAPAFTGNATFDSTTLAIDATNNRVGIGTASPIKTLHLSGSASQIYFEGSSGGSGEGIVYKDAGGNPRFALHFPSSDVVSLCNRASNGTVEIRANTSTAGASGEQTIATFEDDQVSIDGDVIIGGDLTVNGGDMLFDNLTTAKALIIKASDDESAAIEFHADNASDNEDKWQIEAHKDDGDLHFYNFTDGTWAPKFKVTDTGNAVVNNALFIGSVPSGDGSSENVLVYDSGTSRVENRTYAQLRSDLGIADNEIIDWTASSAGTIHSTNIPTLNQDTTGTAAIATTVTVADESSDTDCFPLFSTASTGNQAPKSGTNLRFNSSTGLLTATKLAGDHEATNVGHTGSLSLSGAGTDTNTAAEYAALPVGYHGFMHQSLGTDEGMPLDSTYFYFHKVGNRDQNGGWGGLAFAYNNGSKAYFGTTTDGDNNFATWYKILVQDGSNNVTVDNHLTVSSSINLGHASDTTLTRASAGNVNIEGNLVYRAGGTDVPVADGGTGASNASDARSNLGVDAAGTDNSTDVTLTGTPDYITISGQEITRNQIDLANDVTGTLPVSKGGTGATSLNNLITLGTHTTGSYVQSLVAGNLIDCDAGSEGGTPTIDVDLSEALEASIADGDYIIFLDGGATGTEKKEALHDVATLFAGSGLTATNSVLSVDDNFLKNDDNDSTSGTITAAGFTTAGEVDAGSLDISGDADIDGTLEADALTVGLVANAQETAYITAGTSTTEILWGLGLKNYGNLNVTDEYGVGIKFRGGGNSEHHKWAGIAAVNNGGWFNYCDLVFYVDEAERFRITKNGDSSLSGHFNITTGHEFKINDTSVLSASTLGSGVTASSLTSVGTISSGTWNGTAIASAYLDADTAHLSGTQTFSGAKTFSEDLTINAPASKLLFRGDDTSENHEIESDGNLYITVDDDNDDTSNFIQFRANGATNLMKIQDDGNVGIGNTSPTRLLHLDGDHANGELILIQGDASYGGTIRYQRGTSYSWRAGVGGGSSTDSNIPASYWGIEDVSDSNTPALVVAHSTQNVGIGLTNPTETLHVDGNVKAVDGDFSGNIDVDGTMEADAITVNGSTLASVIEGTTVTNATNATNATHVSVADNENTNENNLIPFIENQSATGNVGLESDGDFHYNPSTGRVTATQFVGTLMTGSQTNITSVGTIGTGTWQGTVIQSPYLDHELTDQSSILNASLVIGRDADNQVKFSTDDQIIFRVAGGDGVTFKASGEIEATTLDISGDVTVGDDLFVVGNNIKFNTAGASFIGIEDSSGENTGGSNLFIDAGAGTGNAAGGEIYFRTADGGGSGSSANSHANALVLADNLDATFGNDVTISGNNLNFNGGGIINAQSDLTFRCDSDQAVTPNTSKFSFKNGGNSEIANIDESGNLTVSSHIYLNNDKNLYLGTAGNEDKIYSDGTDIHISKDDGDVITVKDDQVRFQGPLYLAKQAAALGDSSSYGQIWVNSNYNPSDLHYTDGSGNDVRITNNGKLHTESPSHFMDVQVHSFYSTSSSGFYMPFGPSPFEGTSTADSANDDTLFIVPYDGSLEKIVIQNANTVANMGNVRMQLRVNGTNGTAVQVSMVNETTATFTFTTSNTFSAGDRIRILMTPVGGVSPLYASASSVWKYTL